MQRCSNHLYARDIVANLVHWHFLLYMKAVFLIHSIGILEYTCKGAIISVHFIQYSNNYKN